MLKAILNLFNVDLQNESRRMIKRGARCPSTVCLSQFSALTFIYYRTRREVKPGEQFLSILPAR